MHFGHELISCQQKLVDYVVHCYTLENKISPNNVVSLKWVLIPNCLNNPLACCSLMNLDFLLLHTNQYDSTITFLFLVFCSSWFLLSVLLFPVKQYDSIFL